MYERGLLGPPDPAKAAELRQRAQQLDPDSPMPVVPPGARARPRQAPRYPAVGHQPGRVGSGDANAENPLYNGTVHVNRWHGVATRLPRCWPFCTVN
jgi:hypothetical protein